jgi:hypothetical protein
VIERIICDGSVDISTTGRALGFEEDWHAEEVLELTELQKDHLLSYADGKLSLTPEGLPLARVVAAVFDAYLRHSTADIRSRFRWHRPALDLNQRPFRCAMIDLDVAENIRGRQPFWDRASWMLLKSILP